jgi:hypothetical protein
MDINWCIDYLKLNANTYKLNQSNAPHHIIYWAETNPDKKPTDDELAVAWAEIEADQKATKYQRDRKPEYPLLDDVTVALAEKAEGRPEMWDEITVKRATVRTKYPKE